MLVLLSQRAAWKLTDFDFTMTGGSKLAYGTNSAHGTNGYRDPDLMRGKDAVVSMKTDVWSLGCVMYELLTGTMAFPSEMMVCEYYSNQTELKDPALPEFLCPQLHKCIILLLN